ncbi:hypothetical protein T10_10299 [Trichinella papuae]|uniref:Uncharacterized protein n=1 Tax=Trichinella papuae TaxID=268474 RepID=A0A0V1MBH2_9BILA|nr:hypothetical protein T10_10299 [Trichinella papuae]
MRLEITEITQYKNYTKCKVLGKNCVEKEKEKEDDEEEEETPLAHWPNADLTRKSTQIED